MDLLGAKVCTLCLIFAAILLFFLLPIAVGKSVFRKGAKGQFIIDCITCFGGGVFLGVFMLHLAPEIRHLLEHALLEPRHIHYPVPEAIAGGGFFLMLFIDKLISYCQNSDEKDSLRPVDNGVQNPAFVATLESGDGKVPLENGNAVSPMPGPDNLMVPEQTTASRARAAVMLFALSLDCIFEGLSLGLKSTNVAVWNMFAGILGHEVIISFCLGIEFVKTQPTRWVILCAFIYAVTPVLGIGIGIAVFQTQRDNDQIDLITGCLQAIASGVILYVTFIGVLSKQLSSKSRFLKILCVFLGFGLMTGLAAIPHHHDDHHHHHNTTDHDHIHPHGVTVPMPLM